MLACIALMLTCGLLIYRSDYSTFSIALGCIGAVSIGLAGWNILKLSTSLLEAEQEGDGYLDIIERAADGIITADNFGLIQKVNPAAEKIFGHTEGQLRTTKVSSLFSAEYSEIEEEDIWDFLQRHALNSTGETQEVKGIRHASDQPFYMEISISPFVADEVTFTIMQVRDVTQRRAAAHKLEEAHALLEHRVEERTAELKHTNEQLQTEIEQRKAIEAKQEKIMAELSQALKDVKILSGLIPICASCKSVRDDSGFWQQIEGYLQDNSEAMFSHGICPDCTEKLYPGYGRKDEED